MTIFSTLKTSIGNMHYSDPDDILQTRHHFKEIGIDAGGDDRPVIDKPLDNAIRTFQRELGLKEDGIMNPKGETENTLNNALDISLKTPPKPEKKPQTPQEKEEAEERLKERWKDIKTILHGISKTVGKRILFLKEVNDRVRENNQKGDPI